MQFGVVLEAGYATEGFSLKKSLQERRGYNFYLHALFVDLVNGCNSMKHEVVSLT